MKDLKKLAVLGSFIGLVLALLLSISPAPAMLTDFSITAVAPVTGATTDEDEDTDPLAGERHLLRDDEIIVSYSDLGQNPSSYVVTNRVSYPDEHLQLGTPNVTSSQEQSLGSNNQRMVTVTGRMHTDANDEYFNVYIDGSPSVYVEARNPATGYYSGAYRFGDPPAGFMHMDCAAGDFNGDGSDELVVAYEGDGNYLRLFIVKAGADQQAFELGGTI